MGGPSSPSLLTQTLILGVPAPTEYAALGRCSPPGLVHATRKLRDPPGCLSLQRAQSGIVPDSLLLKVMMGEYGR